MKSRPRAAVMYLIAALCFLIAGVAGFIGDTEANAAGAAFIVLCIVFAVLALNVRQSGRGPGDR
ncbi:MAG TPA: hypothetical protein VLT15_07530 [Acidimicrobiia bacterium]|nr:hypothetical protein [Acidimicrobiia bacterium]